MMNDEKGKRKGLLSDNRPSFFKIIHNAPHQSHEYLEIPPHFINKISEKGAQVAVLKGPKTASRDIKVSSENEGGLYFKHGWKEFLDENEVGDKGILIFKYNGNMIFDVKAFNKLGCEILESVAETTHDFNISSRKTKTTCVADLEHPQPNSPEDNLDDEIALIKTKRHQTSNSQDSLSEAKTKETKSPLDYFQIGKKAFAKGLPLHEVGERALKAVEAFDSQFPFFASCMRKYNVRTVMMLTIPISFDQKHFGNIMNRNIKFNLRNEEGKIWVVKAVTSKVRGRTLSGGWRACVLENKIKEGDICIFEFVRPKYIQFHIFRCTNEAENAGTSNE